MNDTFCKDKGLKKRGKETLYCDQEGCLQCRNNKNTSPYIRNYYPKRFKQKE